MLLDHACKQAATSSRAVGRFGANGSRMIDRPANWMIDDSSSSVAVQLLAKDASLAHEHFTRSPRDIYMCGCAFACVCAYNYVLCIRVYNELDARARGTG